MDEHVGADPLAIIAGQYDCVAEVMAERDRLRAVVDGCPRCSHPEGTVEIGGQVMTEAQYDAARFPLIDERDRLRRLIYLIYRSTHDRPTDEIDWLAPWSKELLAETIETVKQEIVRPSQLDGSGVTNG